MKQGKGIYIFLSTKWYCECMQNLTCSLGSLLTTMIVAFIARYVCISAAVGSLSCLTTHYLEPE